MKLHKHLASLLMASLILTSIPIIANDAVPAWVDTDVFKEFDNNTSLKEENLSKAQFAQTLTNLMGYHTAKASYRDIVGDKWYSDAVAHIGDIMHQDGTLFNPLKDITREEVAYALVRAYKLEDAESTLADESAASDWAINAIKTICNAGYMQTDEAGNFNPKASITGEELIKILTAMNAEVISKSVIYTKDITGNVIVNASGVTFQNMKIDGDLYLAEGIDAGTIKLENAVVNGRVIIEGGTINADKKCKFNQPIEVYAPNSVELTIDSDPVDLKVNASMTITGNFNKIEIGAGHSLTLETAIVNEITANKEGEPSLIDIKSNSSVEKITADSRVTIQGNGKLVELISNTQNVTSSIRPDKITGTVKPSVPSASSVDWNNGYKDHDEKR